LQVGTNRIKSCSTLCFTLPDESGANIPTTVGQDVETYRTGISTPSERNSEREVK